MGIVDIKTGKEMTRRDFIGGGIAAASAVALAGSANASVRHGLGARLAANFGGGSQPLPYDYGVQYLICNGVWFTLGTIENATEISIGCTFNDLTPRQMIFGDSIGKYVQMWNRGMNTGASPTVNITSTSTYVSITYDAGQFYVNGDMIGTLATTFNRNCYVGSFAASQSFAVNANIYSVKVSSDNTNVKWIPCVKDGVACFYDELSQSFVYHSGSGTCTEGPRI